MFSNCHDAEVNDVACGANNARMRDEQTDEISHSLHFQLLQSFRLRRTGKTSSHLPREGAMLSLTLRIAMP